MSIIMTAGNRKTDWSPKVQKLDAMVKVASVEDMGGNNATDEADPLLDAAKKVMGTGFGCEDCGKPELPCGCGDVAGDVSKTSEAPKVDEAIEKVEEAVADLKSAVSGEPVDEVVEIEIEDDKEEEEVEVEIEDDEEGEGNEDIIIESSPDAEGCDKKKGDEECDKDEDPKMDKSAASDAFCKLASLSPVNKKKLAKYWKDALGYPKDYVDLMLKNYEK